MDDSSVKDKIEAERQKSSSAAASLAATDLEKSPEVEVTIAEIRDHFREGQADREISPPSTGTDYQFDEVVFFGSSGRGKYHTGQGWHRAEDLFTWTEELHAFLHFSLPPTENDLSLEFKASGYLHSKIPHQDVLLEVNGILCARLPVGREYGFSIMIPKSIVDISREFILCFTCLHRASPSQFKSNLDRRTLGMALQSLVIHQSCARARPSEDASAPQPPGPDFLEQ